MPFEKIAVTGNCRNKCIRAEFENPEPEQGLPGVVYHMRLVTELEDGRKFFDSLPPLSETLTTPEQTFPLLDPVTMLPSGESMTHYGLFIAIVSHCADLSARESARREEAEEMEAERRRLEEETRLSEQQRMIESTPA